MRIAEPTTTETLFSTKSLIKQVESYIEELKDVSSPEKLYKFILADFNGLCNYFLAIGNQEYSNLEAGETVATDEIYLLHYTLSDPFKEYAILHRDVLLQLSIASNKFLEAKVSAVNIITHFERSQIMLIEASESFASEISKQRKALYEKAKKTTKVSSTLRHRKNPWGIYKEQLLTVQNQFKEIDRGQNGIKRTITIFDSIKKYNAQFFEDVTTDANSLLSAMGETIKSIKTLETPEQILKSISIIDQYVGTIKDAELQRVYTANVELKLKSLIKVAVPVTTDNGVMLSRKLDFNKASKKWFDFEILPELMDLWDKKLTMASYFKHSLLNLKSSLLIAKSNNTIETVPSQIETLKIVHQSLAKNVANIKSLVLEIEQKFQKEFQVTNVYGNDDFLDVSLQSSLSQFATEQGTFLQNLKKQWDLKLVRFNKKYDASTLFSEQNTVEQAIACINYRMFKENNAHYDTLFLNKNFIGDLFLLPRVAQDEKLAVSLGQWRDGFSKAVLVTGDRLSGKSTFMEYTGQQQFHKNKVELGRDSNITFGGRKFKTTTDLADALSNISKGLSATPNLLIIDNLELWNDAEHSLVNNVRALLQFIENAPQQLFIMVSTTPQMKLHLDKRVSFSTTFSTSINLNKATFDEIFKAIWIRHGASHKVLVNPKVEPYTENQIEQEVSRLARDYNYNIGEVLQAWTFGTTVKENNKVVYEYGKLKFKDFFTDEEIILLKYATLYSEINEKLIHGFVGERFETTYKSGLKRLTNTKVVLRDENGTLHLNPVLYSDIKQLLIYKGQLS